MRVLLLVLLALVVSGWSSAYAQATATSTPTVTSTPTNTPTNTPTFGPVSRGVRAVAARSTRVQNTTSATIIRWGPVILHRIVVANANAAVQTLTILDGASTLAVVQVPTKTTLYLEFEAIINSGLVITPGSTDIDALVIYD